MEGSPRAPCIARWPGKIAAGIKTDEIFRAADWCVTLARMAGITAAGDDVMDGVDQSSFLFGKQVHSNRDRFAHWMGEKMRGEERRHFDLTVTGQECCSTRIGGFYDAATVPMLVSRSGPDPDFGGHFIGLHATGPVASSS
jgi:arylsulfatase A-like enzyme